MPMMHIRESIIVFNATWRTRLDTLTRTRYETTSTTTEMCILFVIWRLLQFVKANRIDLKGYWSADRKGDILNSRMNETFNSDKHISREINNHVPDDRIDFCGHRKKIRKYKYRNLQQEIYSLAPSEIIQTKGEYSKSLTRYRLFINQNVFER